MNDEIKEILKRIKSVSDFDDYVDFVGTEFKPLLNCITNLQKENKNLHSIIKEVRNIFKDYGDKEDIVGYSMYYISGETLINLLEILDKEEK